MTKAFARSTEYPYSNPIAAYSDSNESNTKNWFSSEISERSGVQSAPVF